MLALTYDDGPDPEWTPRVLDALARAGARATFFPLSPRAAAYPELIARTRAEGHLVGLHGWAHLKHPESTRTEVEADTDRALGVFDERPRWWRLPYGMAAPWSAELAAARELTIAGWTHDTHDWRGDTAAQMHAAVSRRCRHRDTSATQPTEVVLMHDALGPGVRRAGCAETVALTERLLEHGSVRLDELPVVPSGRPG